MKPKGTYIKTIFVLAAPILMFVLSAPADAATLHVANNGVDGASCGGMKSPCRSISQVIENASDGDRIIVGPGRYGDLNGNGDFTDLGDEDAEFPSGCVCMIKVDKSVSLESSDGAGATVLNVLGADLRAVVITADGVVFGKSRRGFTLANSRRAGLVVDGRTSDNVTVAGNHAVGNGTNGNDAFEIGGTGHTVTQNVAIGNARGGFGIGGTGHTVTHNVASGNLLGFFIGFRGHLSNNVANGNTSIGMDISAVELDIHRNVAIGNGGFGIRIGTFVLNSTFTMNNIFGNDAIGGSNCGLVNSSGQMVDATNNFWGAASGPGSDPADDACDTGGGTVTVPFASKEFNIVVKAGQ